MISSEDLNRIYSMIRATLYGGTVGQLRTMAGAAGFDITRFPGEDRRAPIFAEMDRQFRSCPDEQKVTALGIMADWAIGEDAGNEQRLRNLLQPHGFDYVAGSFVPVGLLDRRESAFLPPDAQPDLSNALTRLANGDYSGAISAACGTVDSVTQAVYESDGLGKPPSSFQAKVNTLLNRRLDDLFAEYREDGLTENDARDLVQHVRNSTSGAANALQILRRTQGDVHGTRPATVQTVYHAIRSAAAICGILMPESAA